MPESPVRGSTRISISWAGAPAGEDTDTLVLTINGVSLDLRVYTEGPEKGQIDWATVGSVSEAAGSTPEKPILSWTNILDSRPPAPTGTGDEGSFSTLPNGDVLETGKMYNPKSGVDDEYEEVWRRLPPVVDGPGAREYIVLERADGLFGGREGEGPKAWLASFAGRALGIGKVDGEVSAWRDEIQVDSGHYKRIYEFGQSAHQVVPALPVRIPLAWLSASEGDIVEHGGAKWRVFTAGVL